MEVGKEEVIAAMAVLGSVVSYLWVKLWGKISDVSASEKTRLDECEAKHAESEERYKESRVELAKLSTEFSYMKGQMDTVTSISSSLSDDLRSIKTLSEDVLTHVKNKN